MSDRTDSERLRYQEHHYQDVKDVGIAFDGTRVWICINGVAALRAKQMGDQLLVEFYSKQIDAAMERPTDEQTERPERHNDKLE